MATDGSTLRPLRDREYLALTLYGEARGESLDGKLAVASVLMNRQQSGRWGATFSTVCLAPKQFSCWNVNDVNLPLLRTIGQELCAGIVRNDDALRQCLWIADGVMADAFESTVERSTHYFVWNLNPAPAWAATGHFVGRVGAHLFFQDVK